MTFDRPKPSGRFSVDRLFQPDSVAVIGAGSDAGLRVMANLMAVDFRGAILPIDADLKAVRGILAYPDCRSLPIAPDMAVVAGSGPSLPAVLSDLVSRGCFAAVLMGIAPDLRREDLPPGLRVLGPGSFGVAVPATGLNASQSHRPVVAGRLALVSQSASLCRAVLDWAEPNGVGFSHIVGVGGNLDIGFGMVLDWLSRDPGTGTILLDIRQIRDRRAFLSAARAAARLRPVVAIRAGGLLLDPSGAADLAFEAALRRAGILFVSRIDDMLAAAETLARSKPVRHEAIAIVTNAVGPGRFAADAAIADGLSLVTFAPETEARLRAKLPEFPAHAGGLVHVAPDRPASFAEVAAVIAEAPEVGGVLAVHAPLGPMDDATIDALAGVGRSLRIPLLAAVLGETTARPHRQILAEAGLPVFTSPEQAARGFRHLVQNRRNRAAAAELPPSTVLSVSPDRGDARRQIDRARGADHTGLTEEVALSVLSGYGLPTVPTRSAMGADDAAVAAAMLGFPVVLKLRREAGRLPGQRAGIVLDVSDAEEARGVADSLLRRRRADRSGLPPLIVQRRVDRARELRIRFWVDAMFGPVIGFGQGGTAGSALGDMAVDLPPLNLPLAQALIARSKAAAALAERPELPAANLQAVAECLVRISQLIVDFPEISSMEIDPIFADVDGILVADAAIGLHPLATPLPQLAISPYPVELVERWNAKGEAVTIRPIRPEDAEEHEAFFARLSPEDVRFRFFSSVRSLSPEQVARLTQVDYDREMAFIAQRDSTGETVGVARLVLDLARRSGEFAVIVQPDIKGRGLAGHLMRRLIDWGRSRGLAEIAGQVLADNAPMLAFVRQLGFSVRRLPEEPDVVEARLILEPGAV